MRNSLRSLASLIALVTVSIACLGNATVASANYLPKPRTRVFFVDPCTKKPTAVATPDGAILYVKISHLRPGSVVRVDATVMQAMPESEHPVTKEKRKGYKLSKTVTANPNTGTVTIIKHIKFSDFDKLAVESMTRSVWNVQVNWLEVPAKSGEYLIYSEADLIKWQNSVKDHQYGGGFTSIYYAQNVDKRFYHIMSAPLCIWETPISVASKYHYNDTPFAKMTVSKEFLIEDGDSVLKGINFGVIPDIAGNSMVASTTPLLLRERMDFGWLFGGFVSEHGVFKYSSLKQSWNLGKEQGGFIGQRLSFNRVEAEEFTLGKDAAGCTVWKPGRKGFLDIGKPTLEFTVVPRSMSGDPVESAQFMEKMRPRINSCGKIEVNAKFNEAKVIGSGEEDLLFFFPVSK